MGKYSDDHISDMKQAAFNGDLAYILRHGYQFTSCYEAMKWFQSQFITKCQHCGKYTH